MFLLGFCGYYLLLWNDEDFFGLKWYSDLDLKLVNLISNVIIIVDFDFFWKVFLWLFLVLIGRIVSKIRLNYYGKFLDEKWRYFY